MEGGRRRGAPAADLRRPRVAAPGDGRAGALRPARPCPRARPSRPGRRTATPRRGWTGCATGACSTPPASSCTTRGRRPRAPAAARASSSVSTRRWQPAGSASRHSSAVRGPWPSSSRERVEGAGRGRLDVRAVAGARLLEPALVEVVAQVGRRPERLAVLVGDPVRAEQLAQPRLAHAGPARLRPEADVDHPLHARGAQLGGELLGQQPLVSDRPDGRHAPDRRITRMPAPYSSSLAEELAPAVLDRLLRYVRVDTQSARDRTSCPSTPGQLELGRMLVRGAARDRARRTPSRTTTATSSRRCPPPSRARR